MSATSLTGVVIMRSISRSTDFMRGASGASDCMMSTERMPSKASAGSSPECGIGVANSASIL